MPDLPYTPFAKAALDADLPLPQDLKAHHGQPPVKRFGVYRNTIMSSLIEALRSQFEAVERLIGADYFKALAKIFVQQQPPRSPVLADYGDTFPAFLAGFPPLGHLPFLADVARIERAQIIAFHAADAQPLSFEDLQAYDEDALAQLVLALHPAAKLVVAPNAAFSIWHENAGDEHVPDTQQDYGAPQTTLITRPVFEVHTRLASFELCAFLQGVERGRSLGKLLNDDMSQAFGEALAYGALILPDNQQPKRI